MMGSIRDNDWDDEEYSVIGDKGELGFIDFEDDRSMCSYNEMDEGVVTISVPFTFIHGKPQSVFAGETTASSITIKNTTEDPVELWSVKIFCSNPENSFTLSLMEPPSVNSDVESMRGFLEAFSLEDRVLQPYQSLTIWLSCKPKDIGLHTTVVHFDVGDERIERVVFLLAEDKISQSLASNRPFKRTPRSKRNAVSEYVAGSRPSRAANRGYKNKLPAYAIPEDARELLESKKTPEALKKGLTKENYASYFRNLLIMEEIHMEEEMRNHDMERVTMKKKGRYFLALEVPGLAERRPSLVHGDYVFASLASEKSDDVTQYQGYIHRVEADEVFLRFANEFHLLHQDDDLYNISFTYNRVTYRRLYQAVDAAEGLERELLFPSLSYKIRVIKTTAVVPLTRALNEEQMRSVEMILGCKGAPPYVIYGPPGTGKTVTLVEAILQLYTTRKNTRILVCASSNSAADHILEKIISKEVVEVQENEIFRLNAPSRQYDDMQPDKIHFCFFENFIFKCPPLKALLRYRIIVSTYASAHLLHAEGVPKKHFTHVFLDEAGQASEPETMITISNLCRRETVVVLAGDPQQLGPVVFSREADIYGLGKSYLQRLFDTELYSTANENFITKLVRNYRCHPAILELPSQLFYNGELIACKEERCYSMDAWLDLLPNKEFPVLFVGIQGCDEREGSNPSWFNRIEASKVVEIIKKLRSSTCLTDADIGVITPYRQQVLKLKRALETLDMPDIKVGSVEQFQGLERQVIIISTVRSTVKHNEFDRTYCLGFLSNHRRFNVAVTRAISLLIIVGNPHIISKDPYWNKLLRHCSDNGSYQGCPLPERQDDADKNPFEEDNLKPSEEAEWGDSFQAEEIPKPVPDEAEWSDGWK